MLALRARATEDRLIGPVCGVGNCKRGQWDREVHTGVKAKFM